MVFKVEAKTAIDESQSWVRIARNRLLALAEASPDADALRAAAAELECISAAISDVERRLRNVDDEWRGLLAPRPVGARSDNRPRANS